MATATSQRRKSSTSRRSAWGGSLRYLNQSILQDHRDGFLEELCFYFTRLIFQSVGIDQSKEIPLSAIKEAILRGDSESELLTMFCGADL
jgi:hypothetical protein